MIILKDIETYWNPIGETYQDLSLAYPEHLSLTYEAHTLSCQLTILHRYCLGMFRLSFGMTFHSMPASVLPFLTMKDTLFLLVMLNSYTHLI